MAPPDQNKERRSVRSLRLPGIIVLVIVSGVVIYGAIARSSQSSRLKDLTEAQAVPNVAVVSPGRAENQSGYDLPGRLEAFIQAPIYARVPGYLKSWKHDIGSKVKAGDLLAEIDTPDIDQQLAQARASLAAAQANAKLSEVSAKRWQSLADTDAVSKQDVDQRRFTADADIAQVKAAQANVDRLSAEEGFKRLVAPFDGVVTARDTDIGQLINVGSAGAVELFVVSETQKLRVYVNVPQSYVPSVPPGTKATIRVPEHPGKTYLGTVEASAQSVTASSGTTLMQIIVDNKAGELLPGSYASIRLDAAPVANALSVPSSALIFDAKGLSIAIVDGNNKVQVKPVTLSRDLGAIVEIATGIAATDQVIENPPDGIANGDAVHVIGKPAPAAASAAPTPKGEHG
jgi:RND family efflux transporter MFP subunit